MNAFWRGFLDGLGLGPLWRLPAAWLEVARLRVQLEHALSHNAAESEDAARYVELRDHRLAHALRVWHNNADGGATGPLDGQHLDDAVDAAKMARLLVPYNVI